MNAWAIVDEVKGVFLVVLSNGNSYVFNYYGSARIFAINNAIKVIG